MQRYGQIINLKADAVERYDALHANVWPAVLATIRRCNIRNYTIFRHGTLLFAYFEYVGTDFAADQATMAADPATRDWWALTEPLQIPLEPRAAGTWWTRMSEVFHTE